MLKEGLKGSRIEKIRHRLIKCCYWYYVKCDPIISDHAYDILFDELKQLEKTKDPAFYPTESSPTQMIYGDLESQYPEWAKNKDMLILYDDDLEQ